MAIRVYKPTSPARRFMSVLTYEEITTNKPEKSLLECKKKNAGRMSAQLMAKEGQYAQVRLPSGEVRKVPMNAMATIGTVGNTDHENVRIGKAGRKRHMGVRPTVRGVVMNPCDHPHGGGEGKSPVGMPAPVTPWGKVALGLKTRKHKKYSNKMIVKRAGK